ncbi:MAG: DUF433 domain-containing protein [Candidatus Sumerlaeia bacterium]|nr:DUF433 domain-containing protein [Candidatus Sumerlaeia bacterium]
MTDHKSLERITLDHQIMSGKPVIRGTRLTVEFILRLLAQGSTPEDIISEYPRLVPEDIRACLHFASRTLESASFLPLEHEV